MIPRIVRLVLSLGFLATPMVARADDPVAEKPKDSFWIIPHTHWEGAVFKTREEYLDMGLPYILKAMHLLRTQPDYRFVLDQVAYVRPFLERYPEQEDDFRRFLKEGRLQLVLGLDVMPDVNMPGGETFVRQMMYGKGYYREKLGVDVKAGWLIDTFGHHAQMPQLLTKAGYTSFWFSRGVNRPDHPSEFLWEGIDGSRIAAFWLPYSYGLMYGSPRELPAFNQFVQQRFSMLTPNARGPERLGLAGVDVCDAEDQIAPMVAAYNKQPDAPIALKLAVPSEYEAVIGKRPDREVFKGELNPIFQGTYSSRIELKHWMRDMESRLTAAEKLGALAGWLGEEVDEADLGLAWELVMFNETHDLASGVMTDHVYDDTLRTFEIARRLAEDATDEHWSALASRIDTSGEGVPVVVFNALGWARSDAVEVNVGFDDPGAVGLVVVDEKGDEVPSQVVEAARYGDGKLRMARVCFVARDVPAVGHAVYRVLPRDEAVPAEARPSDGNTLENDLYRLKLDRATGALTGLRLKADDWEALSGHGNVVAREVDKGDLWELYRGLDGGSKIAMTNTQPVPKSGQAKLSDEFPGGPGLLRVGPVFSEYTTSHPFDTGTFATTVRVYQGLRRVEFRTALVNNEKYVRYQALFPTSIRGGKNVHEIPFGAMERPDGVEFPAQNWVDHGDGRHGLALLNVGLPGNVASDGTMMVSLLRSHNLGAYGFGGGYEPGMSSESAFQVGKERTMRYALVPHAGDWREARVFRDGYEFNNPLIARKVSAHEGSLPKRWGFLEVSDPRVVVSAVKPGREGTVVVRAYEATGQPARGVRLSLGTGITAADETNLLEDVGAELKADGDTLRFDLTPFEIKTIRLRLAPPSRAR
jgi:alpha-mannosidase